MKMTAGCQEGASDWIKRREGDERKQEQSAR